MPHIIVETEIDANIHLCFDLARDIGFYYHSLKKPTEIPVSGRISGLVEKGDYTTWETNYFIFTQLLTLKVTVLNAPSLFIDEMVRGEFKSYKHEHIFEYHNEKTIMTDKFYFESSYGIIGKIVDALFLKNHIKGLLLNRNAQLKKKAEELSRL